MRKFMSWAFTQNISWCGWKQNRFKFFIKVFIANIYNQDIKFMWFSSHCIKSKNLFWHHRPADRKLMPRVFCQHVLAFALLNTKMYAALHDYLAELRDKKSIVVSAGLTLSDAAFSAFLDVLLGHNVAIQIWQSNSVIFNFLATFAFGQCYRLIESFVESDQVYVAIWPNLIRHWFIFEIFNSIISFMAAFQS